MLIQAINNTGGTLTYSNEGLSIPASSTVTVPLDQINNLLFDGNALSDINAGNLSIGDGVNSYGTGTAIAFLQSACQFYNQSDKNASGSLTAAQPTQQTPVAGGTVVINTNGSSSVGATILGTWVGTIVADGTIDGTNWFAISPLDLSTGKLALSFTANTNMLIGCGSFVQVRLRMSAYTSGTANITLNGASGVNVVVASNTVASNLNAQVVGNAASVASDSGNPVKTGSVYHSALPTPSSGQRVDTQSNQFGEQTFQYRNKYSNITGNATTTVKSGSGRLHGLMINNDNTGGTVTIYDNTAGSGTKIATIAILGGLLGGTGIANFIGPLGLEFSTGLTIVTAGSASNDITVLYQ